MAGNNDKRVIVCANPSCQKKWVQGQPSFKSCSQCGQVKYCSKDCQKTHWKQHKRACKKKAQQIQQQQNQSQLSIRSSQISQSSHDKSVTSPKLNQNQNKKQQNSNPNNSPQLKQGKKQQSPQLNNQSNKTRSPSPTESEVKSESNEQKKLLSEIAALKRERQMYLLDKQDAILFLEQTKKTVASQNEKMESFTERLRLTLNKIEKIHKSLESVKAIC